MSDEPRAFLLEFSVRDVLAKAREAKEALPPDGDPLSVMGLLFLAVSRIADITAQPGNPDMPAPFVHNVTQMVTFAVSLVLDATQAPPDEPGGTVQ